jgi:hypothetical protein
MILAGALLLAASSPTVSASEKDVTSDANDSQATCTEKKSAEPQDARSCRCEPQRGQEQAGRQKEELTSTQKKVLADWRAIEQLQQRVP